MYQKNLVDSGAPDYGDGLAVGEKGGVEFGLEADVVSGQNPTNLPMVEQLAWPQNACRQMKCAGT